MKKYILLFLMYMVLTDCIKKDDNKDECMFMALLINQNYGQGDANDALNALIVTCFAPKSE